MIYDSYPINQLHRYNLRCRCSQFFSFAVGSADFNNHFGPFHIIKGNVMIVLMASTVKHIIRSQSLFATRYPNISSFNIIIVMEVMEVIDYFRIFDCFRSLLFYFVSKNYVWLLDESSGHRLFSVAFVFFVAILFRFQVESLAKF